MVIYIEYVILDNLIIDFLILFAVSKLTKQKIKKTRFLLALIIAVSFAFTMAFINIGSTLLLITKLLMGAVIISTAFKLSSLKQFLLSYLSFIFTTFLMGGICYGLQGFMSSAFKGGGLNYQRNFPISFIFIGAIIFYIGGKNLYFALRQKKLNTHILVTYCDISVELMALIDTGNQLTDGGMPITFVSRLAFGKLTTQTIDKTRGYKQILCSTVASSNNLIDTFLVDKITTQNRTILNPRIAIVDLSSTQGCDAIISEKLT